MKKVLSLFLSLITAFLIFTASVPVAFAAEYSGACGSGVYWNLDTYSGELVISGSGSMNNYSADDMPSWSAYQNYIKSVSVSDGVTSVGDYAFYNITGYKYQKLAMVNLSASVEIIGDYAFRGCKALTTVIGTGVEQIGEYAFRSCEKLSALNLVSVITVGNGAFSYCTAITYLPIPASVTTIGNSAFKGCSGIPSLILPPTLTALGYQAFAECTGLTSVEFSASNVTSAVYGVFEGAGADSGLNVVFGSNVTAIPESLFENCTNLNQVTIGSGVTTIGTKAFYASGVTSVSIPQKTSSISSYAFAMCNRLEGFTVDSSNTYFSAGSNGELMNKNKTTLYRYPSGRGELTYSTPSTVRTVSTGAFYGDTILTDINCANAATVSAYSFSMATALESVSIPLATKINDYAFADCDSLTSISAPKVTSVGIYSFSGCDSLASLSGLSAVVTIGDYAFSACRSLKTLTLPSTVTSVGDYAFYNCDQMTSLTVTSNVKTISEGAFSSCENLKSVTLSSGIAKIEQYAFLDCPALLSVRIPASVTSVGSYAFGYKKSGSSYSAVSGFKVYCYSGSGGYTYAYNNKSKLSYEIVTDGTGEEIVAPENPDSSVDTPTQEFDFIGFIVSFIQKILVFISNIFTVNSPLGN